MRLYQAILSLIARQTRGRQKAPRYIYTAAVLLWCTRSRNGKRTGAAHSSEYSSLTPR